MSLTYLEVELIIKVLIQKTSVQTISSYYTLKGGGGTVGTTFKDRSFLKKQ